MEVLTSIGAGMRQQIHAAATTWHWLFDTHESVGTVNIVATSAALAQQCW